MKTDGAFRRFVGPLQIHVYLILTLPIFFTAFTFFVDVFTLHITPCSKHIASKSLNHTVNINISNITTRTDNHSDLASVSDCGCTIYSLFKAPHVYSVSCTLCLFCYRIPRVTRQIILHMDKRHTWRVYLSDLYSVALYLTGWCTSLSFRRCCD